MTCSFIYFSALLSIVLFLPTLLQLDDVEAVNQDNLQAVAKLTSDSHYKDIMAVSIRLTDSVRSSNSSGSSSVRAIAMLTSYPHYKDIVVVSSSSSSTFFALGPKSSSRCSSPSMGSTAAAAAALEAMAAAAAEEQ